MTLIKSAMEGQGLERVFVTGVSPVALTDVRSGFDVAKDVSLEPELAGLCGFRECETRSLVESISRDRGLLPETVDNAIETMRAWYNGYRFTDAPSENVYNPTDVLLFLDYLYRHGATRLHNEKLRADHGQFGFLVRTAAGAQVIQKINDEGKIAIPQLEISFSLGNLLMRLGEDRGAIVSLLYFMGLLTLTDVPGQLRVPNLEPRRGSGADECHSR
jgi:hypothetical protein